jgi:hypothetical protein
MDQQKQKMTTDAGVQSGRDRKMRIERRYGNSKKHRGSRELHGRGKSRATAETGLMVVAQNTLTHYLLVKRAKAEENSAGRALARGGSSTRECIHDRHSRLIAGEIKT